MHAVEQPKPETGQYDSESPKTEFSYDGPGEQLTSVKNARGDETVIEYDESTFRVSKVINPDSQGNPHENPDGEVHEWEITPFLTDGLEGIVRKPPSGAIGGLEAESPGQFVEPRAVYIDPRDNQWTYQTDNYGLLTAEAQPVTVNSDREDVWRWQRNKHGLVQVFTEPAGGGGFGKALGELVTEYFYDLADDHDSELTRGNLTRVVYAQPTQHDENTLITESWEYDSSFSLLTSYTDPRGFVTTYDDQDSVGNARQLIQQVGNNQPDVITKFEYTAPADSIDSLPGGLVELVTDPRGLKTRTKFYDKNLGDPVAHHGLVKEIISGMGPGEETSGEVGGILIDASIVRYEYDQYRQQVDDDQYDLTEYRYDDVGNVTTIIDPADNWTLFGYDALYRSTSETIIPASGVVTRRHFYDYAGNLRKKTDRENREVEYQYDALGRRTAENYAAGNYFAEFEYDLVGNMVAASDLSDDLASQIEIELDNLYRADLVEQTYASFELEKEYDSKFDYEYNLLGNREQTDVIIDGSQLFTNEYKFDNLNRVTSIEQTGASINSKSVEYAYGDDGRITTINRHDATVDQSSAFTLTDGWESNGGQMRHATDGPEPGVATLTVRGLVQGTYSIYAKWQELDDGESGTIAVSSYNVVQGKEGVTGGKVVDFDDDSASDLSGGWELIHENLGTSANYDTIVVRISTEGITESGFIAAGAIRIIRQDTDQPEVTKYEWDHKNRLTKVSVYEHEGDTAVTEETEFFYDVLNRRVAKKHTVATGDSRELFYVYDGQQVATTYEHEYDNPGDPPTRTIETSYLWGGGVDQLMAVDQRVDGYRLNTTWTLADQAGTIRDAVGRWETVDAQGETIIERGLLWTKFYDSFGRPGEKEVWNDLTHFAGPDSVLFEYTGQEHDSETGLQNSRSRLYDPATHEFISEDPMSFAAGDTNLYRRVGNSPANATDPSGLSAVSMSSVSTGAGASSFFTPRATYLTRIASSYPNLGIASGPRAPTTLGQTAAGITPSRYLPASKNIWGAHSPLPQTPTVNGKKFYINQNAYIKSGGKVYGQAEIHKSYRAYNAHRAQQWQAAQARPRVRQTFREVFLQKGDGAYTRIREGNLAGQAPMIRHRAGEFFRRLIVGGEKEVMLKGTIPKSAITGRGAVAGHYAMRGGSRVALAYAVYQTGNNMTNAFQESVRIGSFRPVTAQTVREVGGWGGAIAGAKAGVLIGAALGIETGPGAVITGMIGGVVGGIAGYFGADWIADHIHPD